MKFPSFLAAALTAALLASASTAQNLLTNGDFELGGLAGWGVFGNAYPQSATPPQFVPLSGNELCTMFGNFSGGFDVSGIFQEFPANTGDQFFMDAASRHWSGDPLTGTGLPDFNWVVMKIAFFDAFGLEIAPAASEAIILDGTSPTDQWIDNTPITATAPIGVATVQALVLFLQPNNDGGAAQIDDVFFGAGSPLPTYPGSGEDLVLSTGINGAAVSSAGSDVKIAFANDILEVNVASPGGTFDFEPYFLLCQTFLTGTPTPGFGSIYLDFAFPYFILVSPTPSPIGAPVIAPGGASTFYEVPLGLGITGLSLMLQSFPISPAAANGAFAISNAHEIQFK